jgi:hypothetical protein
MSRVEDAQRRVRGIANHVAPVNAFGAAGSNAVRPSSTRARARARSNRPRPEKSLRESRLSARARAPVRTSRRRHRLTNALVSLVARSVSKNLPTTSSS